jgi:TolB protein
MLRHFKIVSLSMAVLLIFLINHATANAIISTERQVTFNDSTQYEPDISGTTVVYVDDRFGGSDIFRTDTETGDETMVMRTLFPKYYPKISGDFMVWSGDTGYPIFLYYHRISTSAFGILTATGAANDYDLDGVKVVYSDWSNLLDPNILLTDLAVLPSGADGLTDSDGWQEDPAISSNRVVWTDYTSLNGNIILYDLGNYSKRPITSDTNNQSSPDISGDRIVYFDDSSGSKNVYLYDTLTSETVPLTNNTHNKQSLEIEGDYVIWNEQVGGVYKVFVSDLQTDEIKNITGDDPGEQRYPKIDGNHVVWEDLRDPANTHIWMATLTRESTNDPATELPYTGR